MTDVTPNPHARRERLHRRAVEVRDLVSRLVDDLSVEEGLAAAKRAHGELLVLCRILEVSGAEQ